MCLRLPAPLRLSQRRSHTRRQSRPCPRRAPTGHRFAERTRATHATVHALLSAGHSKRPITRQHGRGLNSILRFSRTTEPEQLFTGHWQSRPTKLDAYKPNLNSDGRKAAPTPQNCGKRSRHRTTRTGTGTPVHTSARTYATSPGRLGPATIRPRPDSLDPHPPRRRHRGLSQPWNSGVVEGHVNQIKMLKRQMLGRAGLRTPTRARPAPLLSLPFNLLHPAKVVRHRRRK